MPSDNYEERLQFFDKVFENGVDAFVHPTGVFGIKIVLDVEEQKLNPFYSSPYPQRAKSPGDLSIFLADNLETAKAEVFPGNSFSGFPPNSWSLEYKYSGNILNINLIPDEKFKSQFLASSGDLKHEFSQDARYYLESKGFSGQYDSIGWTSVRGDEIGVGGFVYNWVSGDMPQFDYINKYRLDSNSGAISK